MDKATVELLARRAGLEKALAEFPDDVAAAAKQAGHAVEWMKAPTEPRAEPGPNARWGRAMTDLHWMTATETARAVAAREISLVELMTALLDGIGQLDPKLNVFIGLDAEAAMNVAKAAEAEITAGRSRGPLHGLPVGDQGHHRRRGPANNVPLRDPNRQHRQHGRGVRSAAAWGRRNRPG